MLENPPETAVSAVRRATETVSGAKRKVAL
jgi:hypothetical protein